MYRLRSAITRMIRRREYIHNNEEEDMAHLSSLHTRCLHTNDKRLIRILLVVACFSVLLQRTLMPGTEPDLSLKSQTYTDSYGRKIHMYGGVSSQNTTLVTAYFNLGSFDKGSSGNKFNTRTYLKWARTFKYLQNALIVYTDDTNFVSLMLSLRNETTSNTKIFLIDRNTSWAFERRNQIAEVYGQPGYPRHKPNTVNPDYACAQIAKYDVISRAAKENVFNTKYYAWIDIGYFRDRKSKKPFFLEKPKKFDDSKIAMNLVYFDMRMSAKPTIIFKSNLVWVGGGLVFGTRQVIIEYEKQFRRAVDHFISIGLMNTDQQINYAMFSNEGRPAIKPEIEIQVYKPPRELDWFYLGFSMIHESSGS